MIQNIIIDVLLEREPFIGDSYKVLKLCEEHKIDSFVSASSVTGNYYLVRKYTHSTDMAYKAVGKLLEIAKVCSVTNDDILIAFQKKAKDFEDCLHLRLFLGVVIPVHRQFGIKRFHAILTKLKKHLIRYK